RIYRKSKFPGREKKIRVLLRDHDDVRFFADIFQQAQSLDALEAVNLAGKSDSQARLTRVGRYFRDHLQSLSMDQLVRLKEFALTRCIVILVAAQGRDTAFTIFTVLNKRGLDLSTVDILKADILGGIQHEGRASNEQMAVYAAPWEELEQLLGR